METDIAQGLPCFNMVGLLSSEVREAKERVRTALKNSGQSIPMYRITVNLSPADRRKEGTGFDFPIALSLLCAMGKINYDELKDSVVIGELGLDGEIKKVNGILPIVSMAKKMGFKRCIIPRDNLEEGGIIKGIELFSLKNISEVLLRFGNDNSNSRENSNKNTSEYVDANISENNNENSTENICEYVYVNISENNNENNIKNENNVEGKKYGDYSDIIGQESVKRALLISASGWHNILMIGPPGVGKSMLASRMTGIMPQMSESDKMEVSNIQSICGLLSNNRLVSSRPFSAPHHTITASALVGGGVNPRPGQITIAHKGVLFLDELPEFSQNILDLLRQPLEEKSVQINRISGNYVFPADCLVVAAMNPCKCGYYPDRSKCNCSEREIKNYFSKISGPIVDRMDMSVEVPRVDMLSISGCNYSENILDKCLTTKEMNSIVERTVSIQNERQGDIFNGRLDNKQINKYCRLKKYESDFMREAYTHFEMSMRGYYKVIKVARTIADIEDIEDIKIEHLSEALGYRVEINRGFV